jgi:hypothetical protein
MDHVPLSIFRHYQPVVMPPHLASLIPPLRQRTMVEPVPLPVVMQLPKPPKPLQREKHGEGEGLKERNRLAAQKWRRGKDRCMTELEAQNDKLRKQALDLSLEAKSVLVENKLLEDELLFFQQFMSLIMAPK